MAQTQIDKIFAFLDQTTEKLRKFLNVPYRDALSENIFNIIEQKTHIEDDYPTAAQAQELDKLYQNFELRRSEERRVGKECRSRVGPGD